MDARQVKTQVPRVRATWKIEAQVGQKSNT